MYAFSIISKNHKGIKIGLHDVMYQLYTAHTTDSMKKTMIIDVLVVGIVVVMWILIAIFHTYIGIVQVPMPLMHIQPNSLTSAYSKQTYTWIM